MARSPAGLPAAALLVLATCGACGDRDASATSTGTTSTVTPSASGHCSRNVDRLADAVTHPHGRDENTYPDGFAGLVADQRHHALRMWWKGAAFTVQEMVAADDRLVGSRDLVAGTRITAAEPSDDGSGVRLMYENAEVPAASVIEAAEALTGVRVLAAHPAGPAPL